MNRYLSIVLLFCLSLQMLSSVSVVTCYTFQKDLIAQYFCENKDRPDLGCEGKCFVRKQLQQGEEERQRSAEQTEQSVVFHLVMPSTPLHLAQPFSFQVTPITFYQEAPFAKHLASPFHPPRG